MTPMDEDDTGVSFPRENGEHVEAVGDSVEARKVAGIMYRVGGRAYPMRSEPQCKTCQSHYRVDAEKAIIQGYAYKVVASNLPEQAGLTARNLEDHVNNGHMPMEETARRVILDRRAEEVGLDVAEQVLADEVSFARIGLQRVFERMANGELIPDLDHGIQFAKFLHSVQQEAGDDVDREIMMQSVMTYQEAIMRHATPEVARKIAADIKRDPVLSGLVARRNAIEAQSSVLDEDDDDL